ncbi:MAG: hypothetical protein WBB76_04855 [Gaiellaceae bacterium]
MDEPKPALARFFEAVAAVMDLDHGRQTLELHFEDGRLRRWFTRFGQAGSDELGRFDDRAQWLVDPSARGQAS